MSGWLLILALLVLGGVLATLGDRLGSRIGKARLSLFRLRPRDTAVVITVLTGSLISALSLGLMLLVSQRLRTGLFELDQLEQRLRDSRQALDERRAELKYSRAELKHSRDDLRNAERGRRLAKLQLGQTRDQLGQAERRTEQLRGELKPLTSQRLALEAERDRLSRDISAKDSDIQRNRAELARVNQQIANGAKELQQLESNLIALRRGDVVISSGQSLVTAKVKIDKAPQAVEVIEALLRQANAVAYQRVLPGETPNRQILLVPKGDIQKLEDILKRRGTWVVSLVSAANVLKGERRVVAFPDVRPNRQVIRQGDLLASTVLEADEASPDVVRSRLNLLLAATFTKAQRQGALADGLQFDVASFNRASQEISGRPPGTRVRLEAIAVRDTDIADPIAISLRWQQLQGNGRTPAAR